MRIIKFTIHSRGFASYPAYEGGPRVKVGGLKYISYIYM